MSQSKVKLFILCAALVLPGLGGAVGLNNPPDQMNVAAEGMGDAVVADGAFFNGTAFNPALLSNAPYSGEIAMGLNASDSLFSMGDYLSSGSATLPAKAINFGAGLNIALKFDDHWGFQIYNNTHGLFQFVRSGNVVNITGPAYLDTVGLVTYSFNPLEDETPLTVGANLKIVDHRIGFINSSDNGGSLSNFAGQLESNIHQDTLRWGLDLGVLYEFSQEKLAFGLSALDLLHSAGTTDTKVGDPLYGVNLDPAPVAVKFGASWHPINPFVLNADLDDIFSDTSAYQGSDLGTHLKLGMAYDVLGIVVLRGGLSNNKLGGGLGIPFLGLDYAYAVDNITQVYTHNLQFKAQL